MGKLGYEWTSSTVPHPAVTRVTMILHSKDKLQARNLLEQTTKIEIEMVWVIVDKQESEENEGHFRFLNKNSCERKLYSGSLT